MVWPRDEETTDIEKIVCYSSQGKGACHDLQGTYGEALGFVRRQRELEKNMG